MTPEQVALQGPLARGATIGILGTGQLGRLLAIAAAKLGFEVIVYGPEAEPPAAQVANDHISAAYDDVPALQAFAKRCAVVTFEFENIPKQSLEAIAALTTLRPGERSLAVSQDRLVEKQFIEGLSLPVAPYRPIDGPDAIAPALTALGGTGILKTRTLGYDGKGQMSLSDDEPLDGQAIWTSLGGVPAVLEARIAFDFEISVLCVRAASGDTIAYDVPINTHQSGVLAQSRVGPGFDAQLPTALTGAAANAAGTIAEALHHVGTLAVEFFVTQSGALLINEIAPRVHNTGHWTLDACLHDQFDNHIRAIAGWPLGAPARHSDASMRNLLGGDPLIEHPETAPPSSSLYLYGKRDPKPGRKMGHLTRLAPKTASPDNG
ncbi:MAG: 5-(carboxyamino)imidazole ribonucleotide synthase [Devosiaceae bacterium]|nr:5-(carboxyamino)imidazole ribonucleotide synthase [Devosiaceae bacterium MH13]